MPEFSRSQSNPVWILKKDIKSADGNGFFQKGTYITEMKVINYTDIECVLALHSSDMSIGIIDNEYKIKLGDRYNYIDLLLYNIKYKCYVVIELKITELKKQYTGQIMTYMNYIDKNIKTIEENKTVVIIICKQDNEYVIKYCSDDRIIAREYQLL